MELGKEGCRQRARCKDLEDGQELARERGGQVGSEALPEERPV